MNRPACYEHTCQKCEKILRAYRNCTGEKHMECATKLPNGVLLGGEIKLTHVYDHEEAKAAGLQPIW